MLNISEILIKMYQTQIDVVFLISERQGDILRPCLLL